MENTPPGTMADPDRRNRILTLAAVALAAALLAFQLLVPPIVGLADEGDCERVMGYAGFRYPTESFDEKYYGHIVAKLSIVAPGWYVSGYLTSETLLAFAARGVSLGLFPGRMFDIRILGAIQALLLLAALGLLVRSCRDLSLAAQVVAAALVVLVYTDVGYAAALNSFYAQTASLLFLLLTFAWASIGIRNGGLRGLALVGYFAAAALFVCSKPQEFVHAPLLAILGVLLAAKAPARRTRVALALASALCVLAIWYYRQIPPAGIRHVGLFHTVFHDLLQYSPDPRRDMEELGIDADLARYVGMHAYMADAPIRDPDFQARFLDRFGYAKIAAFYARHPARFVDRIRRAAPAAFRLRPKYLGNFEKSTGVPPRTRATRFALWSDLRAKGEANALGWLIAFFGGNLLAAAMAWQKAAPRGRLFLLTLLAALLTAGLEFGVCAFGDALDDLGRHLFVFHALCDLVLIADAAWLTQTLASRFARTVLTRASQEFSRPSARRRSRNAESRPLARAGSSASASSFASRTIVTSGNAAHSGIGVVTTGLPPAKYS